MNIETILLISNVVMFLSLVALLGVHIWTLKSQDKREEKYIQALLSKDVKEYTKARTSVQTPQVEAELPKESPYIAETDLSDDEFHKRLSDMSSQFDIS